MIKQRFKLILCGAGLLVLLTACRNVESQNAVEVTTALTSELAKPSPDENMEKEYYVNSDGTYTYEDEVYKYKLTLTGITRGAEDETTYVVLTNASDLTVEDVFERLTTSQAFIDVPAFVLLGVL